VDNILVSARTGLIFTRIQEGAQLGGLTQPQPGQTEPGILTQQFFCLFSFHSPPHRGGGRGGHMVLLLLAAAETKTETIY